MELVPLWVVVKFTGGCTEAAALILPSEGPAQMLSPWIAVGGPASLETYSGFLSSLSGHLPSLRLVSVEIHTHRTYTEGLEMMAVSAKIEI